MVLKLPWAEKRMLWLIEKGIFHFFANFRVAKLTLFSGKVRQSAQNNLNQNLVIGNVLENSFEATLSSKRNVLSLWKGHFSVSYKLLMDEVETIYCEKVRESTQNFLNQYFVIGRFLENSFEATFSSKTNVLIAWKWYFFNFLQIFE